MEYVCIKDGYRGHKAGDIIEHHLWKKYPAKIQQAHFSQMQNVSPSAEPQDTVEFPLYNSSLAEKITATGQGTLKAIEEVLGDTAVKISKVDEGTYITNVVTEEEQVEPKPKKTKPKGNSGKIEIEKATIHKVKVGKQK